MTRREFTDPPWENYDGDYQVNYASRCMMGPGGAPSEFRVDGWRLWVPDDRTWYTYSEDVDRWVAEQVMTAHYTSRNAVVAGGYLNGGFVPGAANGQTHLTGNGTWILTEFVSRTATANSSVLEAEHNGSVLAAIEFDGTTGVTLGTPVTTILAGGRGLAVKVQTGSVDFPGGVATMTLRRSLA
jgi:hypothetical protein